MQTTVQSRVKRGGSGGRNKSGMDVYWEENEGEHASCRSKPQGSRSPSFFHRSPPLLLLTWSSFFCAVKKGEMENGRAPSLLQEEQRNHVGDSPSLSRHLSFPSPLSASTPFTPSFHLILRTHLSGVKWTKKEKSQEKDLSQILLFSGRSVCRERFISLSFTQRSRSFSLLFFHLVLSLSFIHATQLRLCHPLLFPLRPHFYTVRRLNLKRQRSSYLRTNITPFETSQWEGRTRPIACQPAARPILLPLDIYILQQCFVCIYSFTSIAILSMDISCYL